MPDRRYNVIFYGIDESPRDTPRADRQKHDLSSILNILSANDSTFSSASIKDLHRLGQFKQTNTRPRPVLVKFLRVMDASQVLANKSSLNSSISIKPDMTIEERKTENALLKERRSLINNGTERKHIKIRGNCLFVHNKLHGSVRDFQFNLNMNSTNNTSVQNIPNHSSNQMETSEAAPPTAPISSPTTSR